MPFCSFIEPDARKTNPYIYDHIKDRKALQSFSLAIIDSYKWPAGTKLRVRFLPRNEGNPNSIDGTEDHKNQVRIHAPTWTENTSISFRFLDDSSTKEDLQNAEIRIQFQNGSYGESQLGTTCNTVPVEEPTMLLGVQGERFKSLILHEFGHALGAIHEHSSPRANLTWNKERVIESYRGKGIPEKDLPGYVETNILARYNEYDDEGKRHTSATNFDTRSIMIYTIDSSWTQERVQIDWPDGLSGRDKEWIQTAYPPAARTVYGGRFSGPAVILSLTKDSPRGQQVAQDSQYHIGWTSLRTERRNPPSIALGLIRFRLPHPNIKVGVSAENVTKTHFATHLRSSGNLDGFLSCLGSWFAPEMDDRNFQVDTASFEAEDPNVSQMIQFSWGFDEPPEVIVWLQDIDMNVTNADQFSVDTKPANITEEGFELCIKWTGDQGRHRAKVSWIACAKSFRIKCSNHDFDNFTQKNDFTEATNIGTGNYGIEGIYHGIKGFQCKSSHVTKTGLVQLQTHIRDRKSNKFTIVAETAGADYVKVACLAICK